MAPGAFGVAPYSQHSDFVFALGRDTLFWVKRTITHTAFEHWTVRAYFPEEQGKNNRQEIDMVVNTGPQHVCI